MYFVTSRLYSVLTETESCSADMFFWLPLVHFSPLVIVVGYFRQVWTSPDSKLSYVASVPYHTYHTKQSLHRYRNTEYYPELSAPRSWIDLPPYSVVQHSGTFFFFLIFNFFFNFFFPRNSCDKTRLPGQIMS